MFVPALASETYADASVTCDGLTLIVWQSRQLASSTRRSLDDDFEIPVPDPLLKAPSDWFTQSQEHDVPSVTADALSLYADFGGQGSYNAYFATRAAVDEPFEAPKLLQELVNSGIRKPSISYDGLSLYALSGNGSGVHIFKSVSVGGRFATPVLIPATSSPGNDSQPVLSADELTLYFSSTRSDGSSKGNGDIWVARRAAKSVEFGSPHAVDELNSAAEAEAPVWISADGCDILFLRSGHLARARRPQ